MQESLVISVRLAMPVMFLVLFGGAVYMASGWRLEARLLPFVLGLPAIALTLLQVRRELVSTRSDGRSGLLETLDVPVDEDISREELVRRALTAFGWFFGLIVGIWLLGMLVALPLFIFCYVLLQAHDRWWVAGGFALAFAVLLVVIFQNFLRVPFYHGLLQVWLLGW